MIRFFIFLLIYTSLFSSSVDRLKWKGGDTYLTFLQDHYLPLKSLYYNLDKDDQRLTEEMRQGIHYQILRSKKGKIEQILLPLNDELQIHIYKRKDKYKFKIIPIISKTKTKIFTTTITSSPNYNILQGTGSKKLVKIFVSSFKNSLNFKNIRKGDKLAIVYKQKYRLGHPFSMPILKAAMIEIHGKKHFIYLNKDDRYYNEHGCQAEKFMLICPLKYVRISSYFTKRRWHPVLHRWKAHLGVDYAARRGTPVHAAGDGVVTYCRRMGTYGNLIKIRHSDGYETRYAHLKSFRRGIHRGSRVRKGQLIAYVGTTGRSTGPHLHFELRKKGVAINPLKVVHITKKRLYGRKKRTFIRLKQNYDDQIKKALRSDKKFKKIRKFQSLCYIHVLNKKESHGNN